eukprot:g62661.t1
MAQIKPKSLIPKIGVLYLFLDCESLQVTVAWQGETSNVDDTIVLRLSWFGSLGESTCVNALSFSFRVKQRTLSRALSASARGGAYCFKDFQRREVGRYTGSKVCFFCLCLIYCLYALEMICYFVSYLCHICDTFYLKAVRAQQELDMLRQARINSAYVCLWSVVSSYDLLTHDFTSLSLCFRVCLGLVSAERDVICVCLGVRRDYVA